MLIICFYCFFSFFRHCFFLFKLKGGEVLRRIYKLPSRDFITSGTNESLVTNGFGGYFADAPSSSYQGWYQLHTKTWRMQKIIESLLLLDEGEQTALYQQFYGLRRTFASGAQDTIIPYQKTLLYESLQVHGRLLVTFDHRESYEGSLLGRNYDCTIHDDTIIVHFTKTTNTNVQEYEEFIVIKGVTKAELTGSWKEKKYTADHKRKARDSYWVYEACTFIPKTHVVFATGETLSQARTIADIAYHQFDDILSNVHEKVFLQLPHPHHLVHPELFAAGVSAAWSLQSLHQQFFFGKNNFSGIFAGLPWFFQVWSRDELISLKGLIQIAKVNKDEMLFEKIKKILTRYLQSIDITGKLPNRFPASTLGSADALGWLAKRVVDFLRTLKEEKQLYNFFSIPQLIGWSEILKSALEKSKKHSLQDGLVFSSKKETWMDTVYLDDGRPGFRIEIQALFDALYSAIIYLEKLVGSPQKQIFVKEQKVFRKRVAETFLRDDFSGHIIDGVRPDGFVDRTFRPNIFLAAYISPNLFAKKDWIIAFDAHLKKLYLPWGGFATLDPENSLFSPTYTGSDNKSYHHGDSWYFVNNLVAIVLFSFQEEKYKRIAKSVVYASAKDILDFGFAGHASELSSASVQGGEASLVQAWSSATFIELLETIYPSDF